MTSGGGRDHVTRERWRCERVPRGVGGGVGGGGGGGAKGQSRSESVGFVCVCAVTDFQKSLSLS